MCENSICEKKIAAGLSQQHSRKRVGQRSQNRYRCRTYICQSRLEFAGSDQSVEQQAVVRGDVRTFQRRVQRDAKLANQFLARDWLSTVAKSPKICLSGTRMT